MSKSQACKIINAMPEMRARLSYGSEIRVNYRFGDEITAYYTDNAEDAVLTAESMKKEKGHLATVALILAKCG